MQITCRDIAIDGRSTRHSEEVRVANGELRRSDIVISLSILIPLTAAQKSEQLVAEGKTRRFLSKRFKIQGIVRPYTA
jgi:hypothetical protein